MSDRTDALEAEIDALAKQIAAARLDVMTLEAQLKIAQHNLSVERMKEYDVHLPE